MTNIVAQPSTEAGGVNRTQTGALLALTSLFFMWGFVTVLNDIVSPHLQSIFNLNYRQASLVQVAFFFAYFIFSIPAARLINKTGYKSSIVIGLLTMGLGAFLFIPAASAASYPFFLGALMVLAAGVTILQVAANPYVAVLGPAKTASSRLNLTQAFNSLGTTVAPYFGGLLILASAPKAMEEVRKMAPDVLQAYRVEQASSVKLPYMLIAGALIVLAIVIARFNLPHIPEAEGGHAAEHGVHDSVWRHPNLVMGALGIFTYVGAEVAIGSFLVSYMHEPNIGNLTLEAAAGYLSFYWGGAMIGRFIGSAVLQKVPTRVVLGFNAVVACLLVSISMLTTGHIAMWSMLLIGFFNSIMFPSIFTLGIEGLGPLTGEGSGVLIAAIVGGALIPLITGKIADISGIHHAFIVPAICYLYILLFAIKGQPLKRTVTA